MTGSFTRKRLAHSALVGCVFAVLACRAQAQRLTVQQPVVEQFGVGTTISVPDRGQVFLGSVSRAGSTRTDYGLLPSGSSLGLFRSHVGMSSSAWIHDFEVMDRYLLGTGPDPRLPASGVYGRRRATTPRSALQRQADDAIARQNRAASAWMRLGGKAEKRGAIESARRAYRRAQLLGVPEARVALARLTPPSE